ncbi:MAG: sulfur carrier protein ThiS [Chlorobiaceae bacterium]|jgi:sulfur carrier protein|nr:sulfur carrier protein ThiS [Chlorobiaceae bacterium]
MITIELNGENHTIPRGYSVCDLLKETGTEGKTVAVVVNELIIRPENRSLHLLIEGDRVEILIFAGGG